MLVIAVVAIAAQVLQQILHARATERREKEWALERGALLQRIQSPEQAVISHAITEPPDPAVQQTEDEVEWEAMREVEAE